MAKTYHVLSNGSRELPVADGTYTTLSSDNFQMDKNYDDGIMVIAFQDSNGQPVTPTAGTIVAEMSPIEGQWHGPSSGDATIAATEVIAGSATYDIPRFEGKAIAGRVTFSGIAGATTARVEFWRSRQNGNN